MDEYSGSHLKVSFLFLYDKMDTVLNHTVDELYLLQVYKKITANGWINKQTSCKRTKCRPASGRPVQTRTPAAPAQLPRTRCSGPAYGQPDPNGAAGPPSVSWTDCWCPETESTKKRTKQEKGMTSINNCGWKFIKILLLKVKILISHKFWVISD